MVTIRRIRTIDDIDGETAEFIFAWGLVLAEKFGNKLNPANFNFLDYARDNLVWFAYRGERPVGAMLARLYASIFDPNVRILFQDSLSVMPGNPKATHLLMQHFIDFGRTNANHIFTATTENTNIKGASLEKLGFKKLEVLYRMEI